MTFNTVDQIVDWGVRNLSDRFNFPWREPGTRGQWRKLRNIVQTQVLETELKTLGWTVVSSFTPTHHSNNGSLIFNLTVNLALNLIVFLILAREVASWLRPKV